MSTVDAQQGTRTLPVDPHEFLAAAERMTNERDVATIRTVFAPGAVWVNTFDGVVMAARGLDEIEDRWRLMCRFMEARRMFVRKELIAVDGLTLVSSWSGGLAGGTVAQGIEVWRFDPAGRVVEQRCDGFLNVAGDSSIRQSLRMLVAYPVTAATFGWVRLSDSWRRR